MKVAIGAVVGTVGGPAVYARELVRAMAAMPVLQGDIELVVLTDRPTEFSGFCETVHVPLASAWEQPAWDHWKIPRALARIGADLYHGTKGIVPLVSRVPSLVTIHDLAAWVMPETFSLAQRLHQRLETPLTLRRARGVVTVSQASARDLRRFFPEAAARIEVIPNGLTDRGPAPSPRQVEEWRAAQGVTGKLVGYLGTIQPRKNVDALVRAFLRKADADATLLVAGRLRPGYRPAFLDCPDPRVRWLGAIEDAEVPVFLAALDVMVSPSSYEGFGLTLVEAMAAGTPVVAVAASAVPEVVGDAAWLVPEPSEAAIAAALDRLLADDELCRDLAHRGRARADTHTWEHAAEKLAALYLRVGRGVA